MQERHLLPRIINLAVFIALEAASLSMISRNAELQRGWFGSMAHGFMSTVWGGTQRISSYFSLSSANRELAQENFELQQELMQVKEQIHHARIDTMRHHSRIPGYDMIPAEIVKISRNKQHNYLVLNRGFEDGIKEKSGIITRNGVVGIVDAVSEHHSFAFSFQNNGLSISARMGREGSTGLLVWDGRSSNGAVLKEVPLQTNYQPGDTVYTSGHSLLFPADIPLGVTGQAKIVNGSTHEIKVRLFQDFKSIRFVTVVHNRSFDEIEGFQP